MWEKGKAGGCHGMSFQYFFLETALGISKLVFNTSRLNVIWKFEIKKFKCVWNLSKCFYPDLYWVLKSLISLIAKVLIENRVLSINGPGVFYPPTDIKVESQSLYNILELHCILFFLYILFLCFQNSWVSGFVFVLLGE